MVSEGVSNGEYRGVVYMEKFKLALKLRRVKRGWTLMVKQRDIFTYS